MTPEDLEELHKLNAAIADGEEVVRKLPPYLQGRVKAVQRAVAGAVRGLSPQVAFMAVSLASMRIGVQRIEYARMVEAHNAAEAKRQDPEQLANDA